MSRASITEAGYERDALLERARALALVLRERAGRTGEVGRIPDETFADLWNAELFYLMRSLTTRVPRSSGSPVPCRGQLGHACGELWLRRSGQSAD